MFLHTYTFTIDIVPLVLENYYFAGLIVEYKGIIVKMRHQTKRNADSRKGNRRRPIQSIQLGQAPPWRRPRTSQEPTRVRRWRPQACSASLFSGGYMAACKDDARRFPNLSTPKSTILVL